MQLVRKIGLTACFALVCLPAIAAEINRCMIDGKTVYTDMPCPAAATKSVIDTGPAPPPAQADRARDKLDADNAAWNQRWDAKEQAKRDAATAEAVARANRPTTVIVERSRPSIGGGYVVAPLNTCGGPGQPACRTRVELAVKPPPTPPQAVPTGRLPGMVQPKATNAAPQPKAPPAQTLPPKP